VKHFAFISVDSVHVIKSFAAIVITAVYYLSSNYLMGDDGGGSLISPDGVAPSWMVGVSASVIFPCAIKVQKKISSGTGSHG